jgi:hypothetical protein
MRKLHSSRFCGSIKIEGFKKVLISIVIVSAGEIRSLALTYRAVLWPLRRVIGTV